MNLPELVDQLIDTGPYDSLPICTTNNETPPLPEKEDTKNSTTTKPKSSRKDEGEPMEEEDPEEEPIKEDPKILGKN